MVIVMGAGRPGPQTQCLRLYGFCQRLVDQQALSEDLENTSVSNVSRFLPRYYRANLENN